MNIMNFTPGMGPALGFLYMGYMGVAIELIESGVDVSLHYSTEACEMGLRRYACLYANHTVGVSEESELRPSRTYAHNLPVFYLATAPERAHGESPWIFSSTKF